MKNLGNYGVQELNAKEFREVDGGGTLAKWFGYTIGYIDGLGQEFSIWMYEHSV